MRCAQKEKEKNKEGRKRAYIAPARYAHCCAWRIGAMLVNADRTRKGVDAAQNAASKKRRLHRRKTYRSTAIAHQ